MRIDSWALDSCQVNLNQC